MFLTTQNTIPHVKVPKFNIKTTQLQLRFSILKKHPFFLLNKIKKRRKSLTEIQYKIQCVPHIMKCNSHIYWTWTEGRQAGRQIWNKQANTKTNNFVLLAYKCIYKHIHIHTYSNNYKQMFTIALDEDDFETDVLTVTLLHTISGLEILLKFPSQTNSKLGNAQCKIV